MDTRELNAFNDRMVKEWNESHDSKLALEILKLLETHTPSQLTDPPQAADCWWHICEGMADQIAPADPEGALKLLELARVSNAKEGTYATGSGEGIVSVFNVNRIRRKIEELQKRGQPPPRKTCSCGRAFDPAQPLARLIYENFKDHYTLRVGRCPACGDYWRALTREPFQGNLGEAAESLATNEAQSLLAWIALCPTPENPRCTCAAHQHIGWY